MKLLIHGRNLEITPALRDYTQTKLERATSHFGDAVREADVHLSVARNPRVPQQTAEVTVFANGTVIRAQERSENLYASIDLAAGKLARQLRRWKERHSDHHHNPQKKYQVLDTIERAPQLPTGYPGMMVLSLLPPVWFAVMNPRVKALAPVSG